LLIAQVEIPCGHQLHVLWDSAVALWRFGGWADAMHRAPVACGDWAVRRLGRCTAIQWINFLCHAVSQVTWPLWSACAVAQSL